MSAPGKPLSQSASAKVFAPVEVSKLNRITVRSGIVNLGSQAIAVGLQLVSTIILARLLTPAAFGTVGMVTAVTSFAALFTDLGLSSAVVQRSDLNHQQSSSLFWLNVAMGSVVTSIVVCLAPVVAWFYARPGLMWVTMALSLSILITSMGAQHAALLTRQMKFRELSIARLGGAFVTLVATTGLAFISWEHWSLVAGSLLGSSVNCALLWYGNGWRPGWFRRGSNVTDMVHYGLNLTGFNFVNYFSRNLDNILIGRFWGAEALGLYTRAYALMLVPISNVRGPLAAVAFPVMSRLRTDPERFRLYYRQIMSVLALATMPFAAYSFVCSDQIIAALLGDNWLPASPIAKWLALASFIQPVSGFFGTVLLALGLAKRYLYCGVIGAITLSIAFAVGVVWGVTELAITYTVSNYVLFFPMFMYASRGTGVTIQDFVASVAKAAAASVVAVATTEVFRHAFLSSYPVVSLVVSLAFFLFSFVLAYCLMPGGFQHLARLSNSLVQAISKPSFEV